MTRLLTYPLTVLWSLAVIATGIGAWAFSGVLLHGIAVSGSIIVISGAAVSMLRRIG